MNDRVKKITAKVLLITVLILASLAVFLPLVFVVNTSLKSPYDYVTNPIGINFRNLYFSNYKDVIESNNLVRSMINSVIVTSVAVLCSIVFTALISFAVGVLRFKGSGLIYSVAICSMFFAGEITNIPLYLLYTELGFIGNLWALIIPSFVGLPGLGIMVGSSYIRSIPHEMQEAAVIDSATVPQLFFKIYLPLLTPILALTAIMTFQGNWGNFLWPYITVLSNKDAHTFALTLIQFKSFNSSMYGQYCAGLVLMTLPIVAVYSFGSKYFMEGMTAGAVKG